MSSDKYDKIDFKKILRHDPTKNTVEIRALDFNSYPFLDFPTLQKKEVSPCGEIPLGPASVCKFRPYYIPLGKFTDVVICTATVDRKDLNIPESKVAREVVNFTGRNPNGIVQHYFVNVEEALTKWSDGGWDVQTAHALCNLHSTKWIIDLLGDCLKAKIDLPFKVREVLEKKLSGSADPSLVIWHYVFKIKQARFEALERRLVKDVLSCETEEARAMKAELVYDYFNSIKANDKTTVCVKGGILTLTNVLNTLYKVATHVLFLPHSRNKMHCHTMQQANGHPEFAKVANDLYAGELDRWSFGELASVRALEFLTGLGRERLQSPVVPQQYDSLERLVATSPTNSLVYVRHSGRRFPKAEETIRNAYQWDAYYELLKAAGQLSGPFIDVQFNLKERQRERRSNFAYDVEVTSLDKCGKHLYTMTVEEVNLHPDFAKRFNDELQNLWSAYGIRNITHSMCMEYIELVRAGVTCFHPGSRLPAVEGQFDSLNCERLQVEEALANEDKMFAEDRRREAETARKIAEAERRIQIESERNIYLDPELLGEFSGVKTETLKKLLTTIVDEDNEGGGPLQNMTPFRTNIEDVGTKIIDYIGKHPVPMEDTTYVAKAPPKITTPFKWGWWQTWQVGMLTVCSILAVVCFVLNFMSPFPYFVLFGILGVIMSGTVVITACQVVKDGKERRGEINY